MHYTKPSASRLLELMEHQIVILDGAMGTMIQQYNLTEKDFRGKGFLEKTLLFELLDSERRVGIKLTESFAMSPASSVSGMYYAHSESRYFQWARLTGTRLKTMRSAKKYQLQKLNAGLPRF